MAMSKDTVVSRVAVKKFGLVYYLNKNCIYCAEII